MSQAEYQIFLSWVESDRKSLGDLNVKLEVSKGFAAPTFEGGYIDFLLENVFVARISIDLVYGDFFEILDWETGDRVYSYLVPKLTKEIFDKWIARLLELAQNS